MSSDIERNICKIHKSLVEDHFQSYMSAAKIAAEMMKLTIEDVLVVLRESDGETK
jgi:hypothetical protein|tara:strand:- start:13872 stop:14036 length:165 start_codon:yes stop_codon:yes gene_type:complete